MNKICKISPEYSKKQNDKNLKYKHSDLMSNMIMKLLFLIPFLVLLSGCSSARFFELNSGKLEILSQDNIDFVELITKPTSMVHNYCLSINRNTDIGNANLAYCSNELLSRDDLSLSLRNYALNSYNSSIRNLVKLKSVVGTKVRVSIEAKNEFIIVKDISVKEQELIPEIYGELGVPVVVRQENSQKGLDKNYPAEGIYSSRTLLLESLDYNGELITIKLSIKQKKAISRGKNSYQLKHSPGAAFLALIENATIDNFSWLGFTNPSQAEKRRGIFSIGDMSKTKTPLVMIHGLNSDPLIWRNLTMAILNDKALYEKYQIWHVYYPSGSPPLFNAMHIRNDIRRFIEQLDAPKLYSNAVIIGHSMGGIISRTLATDSKNKLWNKTFTDSYENMKLRLDSPIRDIFVFRPIFDHAMVFFLDTPHRGSNVANSVIGSIGSALVTLPSSFQNIFKRFIETIGVEKITRVMQPFLVQYGPNSVQVLRPGHPLMEILIKLPVQGESYSIIGSTSKLVCKTQLDCEEISDGVVSYSSSYIENAADTVIVKSSHNSFKNPDAISFILDKLKRTLNQSDP